jgi:hypothetical protein
MTSSTFDTMKRLAAILFAMLAVSAAPAQAHYLAASTVDDYIKSSKAGGWCGSGGEWTCPAPNWAMGLYYGGDGNPRVGDHSLQFDIYFTERHWSFTSFRRCRIIQRWYHTSYGESYKGAAGGDGYRYCW